MEMNRTDHETLADNGEALPTPGEAFSWAEEAMKTKDWNVAIKRWAVLRVVYPDEAAVWIEAARAARSAGDLDEASLLLGEARHRFPGNAQGWLLAVTLLTRDRKAYDEARLLFSEANRFDNDIEFWLVGADLAWWDGDRKLALSRNREGQERFPDDRRPTVQWAEFAMREKNWKVALDRWELVRKRFRDSTAAYDRAAIAADRLGMDVYARRLRLSREYRDDEYPDQTSTQSVSVIVPPGRPHWLTFMDLVWTKARFNLKAEARRNYLRSLWWIIDPLLYMAVFYVVFGLLLNRGGEGYIAYLLTGLVPFQWFAKTIQHTSSSIVAGKGIMNNVRIFPLFFPLVAVMQNFGKQLPVFGVLLIFLAVYGLGPTIYWLAFIPLIVLQLVLMVAVASLVALLIPFVRDVSNLVPTGIQFALFCSGVFFSVDHVPEEWRTLFFSNPLASLLYQYREVFVEQRWPDWGMFGALLVVALALLGLSIGLYRRLGRHLPRVVLE